MRKKSLAIAALATSLVMGSTFTSFAGWEQSEAGWKYKDDTSGVYYLNGWYWIDGNSDNIAECYYFDNTEIMSANTVVDNYTINGEGQWTVGGVVQTKVFGVEGTKELQIKDEAKSCLNSPFAETLLNLQNVQKISDGVVNASWDKNGYVVEEGYYYFTADNIPFQIYVWFTGASGKEKILAEYPSFIKGTIGDIFNGVKEEYTFSEFKNIIENMGVTDLKAYDTDYSQNLAGINGTAGHTISGHTTRIEFKKDGFSYNIDGLNGKFYSTNRVRVGKVK